MKSSADVPDRTGERGHLYRLALSRLFRLMEGLLKKFCPSSGDGACYWCGAVIYIEHPEGQGERVYIGDLRGQHQRNCPWNEVIDFKGYQLYLEGLDGAGAEKPG